MRFEQRLTSLLDSPPASPNPPNPPNPHLSQSAPPIGWVPPRGNLGIYGLAPPTQNPTNAIPGRDRKRVSGQSEAHAACSPFGDPMNTQEGPDYTKTPSRSPPNYRLRKSRGTLSAIESRGHGEDRAGHRQGSGRRPGGQSEWRLEGQILSSCSNRRQGNFILRRGERGIGAFRRLQIAFPIHPTPQIRAGEGRHRGAGHGG